MKLLSKEERDQLIATLAPHWQMQINSLTCQLSFSDFTNTFAFMTAIAIEVEKMNHHPSWTNTYNTLNIELSTHDAGGLTALDFKLAGIIDAHYAKYAE